MSDWQTINTAPEDTPVLTKIDDGAGVRNEQVLKKQGNLWWFADGSMYVYYRPTHWKANSLEGQPMTPDPSAPLPEERDEDIYRLHRQADFYSTIDGSAKNRSLGRGAARRTAALLRWAAGELTMARDREEQRMSAQPSSEVRNAVGSCGCHAGGFCAQHQPSPEGLLEKDARIFDLEAELAAKDFRAAALQDSIDRLREAGGRVERQTRAAH